MSVAFTRLAVALDGISGSASPELQAQSMTALRCTLRLLNTLLQSGSASSRPEPLQLLMGAVKSRLDALIALTSSPDQESLSHAAELLMIALKCTPVKVGPELSEIFMDCLVRCAQLAAVGFFLPTSCWNTTDFKRCLSSSDSSQIPISRDRNNPPRYLLPPPLSAKKDGPQPLSSHRPFPLQR